MATGYDWSDPNDPPPIEDHSVAKHEIVEAYLRRYVEVLASNRKADRLRLSLVDGFSGGGLYRRAGALHEGSPLIFLRAMEAAHAAVNSTRNHPFNLDVDFFFVDQDPRALTFPQGVIRERLPHLVQNRWNVKYYHSTFTESADNIIEAISARRGVSRAIFLLDQYGYTDVPLSLLSRIVKKLPKAEIILTFAVDSLIDYLSDTETFRGTIERLGISKDFDLRAIHKLKSESRDWRFIIQSQLHRALINGSQAKFFTPFFIHSRQSGRAYWLVHLSSHVRARDEMAKLHWLKHTYFTHHGTAGLNMLGYDPKKDSALTGQSSLIFQFDEDARRLTEESLLVDLPRILSRFPEGATFGQILAETCNNTPATSDIYKNAIGALMAVKELEAIGSAGGRRRKGDQVSDSDVLRLRPQRSLFLPKSTP